MPDRSRRGATAQRWLPSIAALAVVVIGCLIVASQARHLTFSGDDWTFILGRRGFGADVFLRAHSEHLVALPILAYKVLLAVFGARSYLPFMALLLLVHAVACLLLYVLARRHIGPWAALAPTAVLVVLGPAWQDLLWAFQVGYIGAVAAGLGMIVCLERRDPRGDRAAAILLVLSLLCSSFGLLMGVLAAVLILLERPRRWGRLWIAGLPLLLYLAWYAGYGVSTARSDNVVHIPWYVVHALAASLASVTGLAQTDVSPYLVSTSYGRVIAFAAAALITLHLVRQRRLPALAWATMAATLGLWVAECLEYFPGGREPNQSRYQYTSGALVLVAVLAIASARKLTPRRGALLGVATLAICLSNISMLHQRAAFWSVNSAYTSAETGAMEIARGVIAPTFFPEDGLTTVVIGNHNLPVEAGPYFSAVDAFGSAADTPRGLLRRPEDIREAADLVLSSAERLRLQPLGVPARHRGACRLVSSGQDLGEVILHPGKLTVRVEPGSVAELRLRRFAAVDRFVRTGNSPPPFARTRLSSGRTMVMELPRDLSRAIPWRARVVGGRNVELCVLRARPHASPVNARAA